MAKIKLINFYLSSFTVWWGGFVVGCGKRIWRMILQWIFVNLQLRPGTAGTFPMVLHKMFSNCWNQQVFLSVVTKMSFSSWLINVNGEKCFTVAVFCLPSRHFPVAQGAGSVPGVHSLYFTFCYPLYLLLQWILLLLGGFPCLEFVPAALWEREFLPAELSWHSQLLGFVSGGPLWVLCALLAALVSAQLRDVHGHCSGKYFSSTGSFTLQNCISDLPLICWSCLCKAYTGECLYDVNLPLN